MAQKAKEKIIISYPDGLPPLPKQLIGHQDVKSRIKGMEGGFASGKSYWLVYDLLINLLSYPGNECVYGRLTMDEITRTFFPIWDEMCPPEIILSHNKQERKIVLMTTDVNKPSTLHYMPLDDAKGAKHKIKSMNLGYVAVDQLEEISEEVLQAFMGRLRRRGSRRQFAFNANPEGHNWIWKWFIKEKHRHPKDTIYFMNSWQDDAPVPTDEQLEQRAIQLKRDPEDLLIKDFPEYEQYTDNPYLPMRYLMNMLSMPESWKRRYLFGKHDAFEGLIYPEYNEETHIIAPFDTSGKEFLRVVGMDYGKHNPTAVIFADIDRTGKVFITNEIYQRNMDIPTIKLMIRAMNRDKKVDVWVADPSIFKVVTPGLPSVGDLFRDKSDPSGWGISWKPADNSSGAVSAGIDIVKGYLKHDQYTDNKANLYFFRDRCPHTIDELEDYRWKEMAQAVMLSKAKNHPEMPRKYKDHAMDTLRYILTHVRRYNIKPKETDNRISRFLNEYWNRESRNDARGFMTL